MKLDKRLDWYNEKEHRILHKKVYDCKCIPLGKTPYCKDCQEAVLDFMNFYGAGSLTRDLLVESLRKEIKDLKRKSDNLDGRLREKIIENNKLKNKISSVRKHTGEEVEVINYD